MWVEYQLTELSRESVSHDRAGHPMGRLARRTGVFSTVLLHDVTVEEDVRDDKDDNYDGVKSSGDVPQDGDNNVRGITSRGLLKSHSNPLLTSITISHSSGT